MNTKTENLPSLSLKGGSRPIHDLMLRLPALVALSDGGIDFAASKPDLLVNIAVDAGHTMRTMHTRKIIQKEQPRQAVHRFAVHRFIHVSL